MSNVYVEGALRPVERECTVTNLPVTGTIPDHLDGRYLRNGPNPLAEVDPQVYHWFTGDGMVHGVRIRDGKAEWYRNRWIRTPRIAAAQGETLRRARGWPGFETLGANTNVVGHAGKTLALVEGGVANYELTDELDTVGPCDFDGTLTGGYTAHPKRDPVTGELHAVSYHFGRGNQVQYSVIDRHGRARRIVDIEVTGSPMMHDFSLTAKYVVLYDLPVTFDARQAAELGVPRSLRHPTRLVLSGLVGRVRIPDPITAMIGQRLHPNRQFPYRWDPTYPARIGVLPRDGDDADVRWFDVEPCYVFHPLNAYDDGDDIVLDVVRHPKMFATDRHGPAEGTTTLDRWTVDLAAGKVREERLDDSGLEFPRVDERRTGRRHRYGYGVAFPHVTQATAVQRHDLVTGGVQRRSYGPGSQAGEVVFIPNHPDAAEDDGILMGFAYHADTDRSDLMLLDAGTLDTVAAIHLPHRVPQGFHGNWIE
jgi:carotenoid cleavage dioxygenase